MDPDSAYTGVGGGARRSPRSSQGPIPQRQRVAAGRLEAPRVPARGRAQPRWRPGASQVPPEGSLALRCLVVLRRPARGGWKPLVRGSEEGGGYWLK